MAHDVFISYASADKPIADAVCANLEGSGVRCWIAPRDILPGTEWGAAIVDAIEESKLMVLVFSSRANESRQIIHEVERAVHQGLTIIPFRIEDVAPGRSLEYFLSTPHWLDAMSPPLEQHLQYLVESVQFLLGQREKPVAPARSPESSTVILSRRAIATAVAAAAILAVVAFLALSGDGGSKSSFGGGSGAAASADLDPSFVGAWRVESGLANTGDGSTIDWSVDVQPGGNYSGQLIFKDAGTAKMASGYLELHPAAANASYSRPVQWDQKGDMSTTSTAALIPPTMLQFMTTAGALQPAAAQEFLGGTEPWKRAGGAGAQPWLGHWEREARYGILTWRMSFDLTADGRYAYTGTVSDSGKFYASNGHWRQVSNAAGLSEGSYQQTDKDNIFFKNDATIVFGPIAQVTWRRATDSKP